MTIEWNKVTWYSKLAAVILFVGVFWLGFWLGTMKTEKIYVEVPHVMHHTESQHLSSGLTTASASADEAVREGRAAEYASTLGGNVGTTTYGTSAINTIDFSAVPYRIPLTLIGGSTTYTASDTIELSFDYPSALAKYKNYNHLFACNDPDLPTIESTVITMFYVLNDENGELFNFPLPNFLTEKGLNHISFDAQRILSDNDFNYYKTKKLSTRYRIAFFVNPFSLSWFKSACSSKGMEYGDGGSYMGNIKDTDFDGSSIVSVGYSEPFILR